MVNYEWTQCWISVCSDNLFTVCLQENKFMKCRQHHLMLRVPKEDLTTRPTSTKRILPFTSWPPAHAKVYQLKSLQVAHTKKSTNPKFLEKCTTGWSRCWQRCAGEEAKIKVSWNVSVKLIKGFLLIRLGLTIIYKYSCTISSSLVQTLQYKFPTKESMCSNSLRGRMTAT